MSRYPISSRDRQIYVGAICMLNMENVQRHCYLCSVKIQIESCKRHAVTYFFIGFLTSAYEIKALLP